MQPVNLDAMSDLRSGGLSQTWRSCTFGGFETTGYTNLTGERINMEMDNWKDAP